MSEERDLMRAIVRDPEDDGARLVYADWLEEHGSVADQPRAAFIRGQVELAALHEDSPHRRELAFRCRVLLDEHEKAWLAPLCETGLACEPRFHRGFVEVLDLEAGDLEAYGPELFETYPIRRLVLSGLEGEADAVGRIPEDNRLTALDLIANDLTTRSLKKLATMKHLPHLRELGLQMNDLKDAAVKALCEGPLFQGLDLVRLGGNPLGPRARERLHAHFGERVSFALEREPGRLFTIQDDYLKVGWGRDHTQLLMLGDTVGLWLAVFDHAGNLLHLEERPPDEGRPARGEARKAWLAELGYRSATIKVRRFCFADGAGITDFNWWAATLDTPGDPQREELRDAMARWLEDGQYRFDFVGDDAWFDRDGEVTDT